MRNVMTFSRLFVFACALVLTGCVETRFEAPIGDKSETCDARWKGLWVDAGDSKDDQTADAEAVFYVDDACVFSVLDTTESGPLKEVHLPVHYVHAGGKDYVFASDKDFKDVADVKPPHGVVPAPERSYFFARYELHGDRLDVYLVDSERTAKLVIDHTLEGTVDKSNNELHVYVRGKSAQMLDIVRSQPIFDDKPVSLTHSKRSLEEYERSLGKNGTPGAKQ